MSGDCILPFISRFLHCRLQMFLQRTHSHAASEFCVHQQCLILADTFSCPIWKICLAYLHGNLSEDCPDNQGEKEKMTQNEFPFVWQPMSTSFTSVIPWKWFAWFTFPLPELINHQAPGVPIHAHSAKWSNFRYIYVTIARQRIASRFFCYAHTLTYALKLTIIVSAGTELKHVTWLYW